MDSCLTNAIVNDLDGFWAGTTKQERRSMANFRGMILQLLDEVMPLDPTPEERVKRRMVKRAADTLAFLDSLNPNDDEIVMGAVISFDLLD